MSQDAIGRNVVVRNSTGGEKCLVCDLEIGSGETVVSVCVNINILMFSGQLERGMHIVCAKNLRSRIDQCLKEASRAKGR